MAQVKTRFIFLFITKKYTNEVIDRKSTLSYTKLVAKK